jgi:hypothetical protein
MKTLRFEMKVPEDLLVRVDDWRRQQPDLPNRSEAVRRLTEAGLTAKPGTKDSSAPGGSEPTSTRKPAATSRTAPNAKSGQSTQPAAASKPLSREAQLRALREAMP